MSDTSNYPAALDTFDPVPATLAGPNPPHSAMHRKLERIARVIEATLGLNPQGTYTSVRERLDAIASQIVTITSSGWVETTRIANRAVTEPKLADGSVSNRAVVSMDMAKLTGSTIPQTVIVTGSVTGTDYLRTGTGTGNPFWKVHRLGGTLAAGAATVPHDIFSAHTRVIAAQAFYRGDSGEAVRIDGAGAVKVDGTNFIINAGSVIGNRPWRGSIVYTSDTASW